MGVRMDDEIDQNGDPDCFPLIVGAYRFDCYYQRGTLHGSKWVNSANGESHVAVCKCGRGVFGTSLDDVVAKLKNSYSILRPTEHFHWQETLDFNVILGFDKSWIMGTIRFPELLDQLKQQGE
jgi:hypothetical protein